MAKKELIRFNDVATFGEGEMMSLTDMWRALGEPPNKRPAEWSRQDYPKQFIEYTADFYNVGQGHIIKTRPGKGGGTWAHWQIALAYGKYLDPRLHAEVNAIYRAFQEGKLKTSAKVQRTPERQQSVDSRKVFVGTLLNHGVAGRGIAACTNAVYDALWNLDAKGLREKHGLSPRANLRDAMSNLGLASVAMSEALSTQRIKETDAWGMPECADATHSCGSFVRKMVQDERARWRKKIGFP
jgi:hypothetical protein